MFNHSVKDIPQIEKLITFLKKMNPNDDKHLERFVVLLAPLASVEVYLVSSQHKFKFKLRAGLDEQLLQCDLTENEIEKFQSISDKATVKLKLRDFNMNEVILSEFSLLLEDCIKRKIQPSVFCVKK